MRKTAAFAIVLAGPLFGLLAAYSFRRPPSLPPPTILCNATTAEVVGGKRKYDGEARAPYTLVEFADYQCPACGAAFRELPAFLSRQKGKLRFVFRNYPLPFHREAFPAAEAAAAAGLQGKFWPMHDALYEHQSTLSAAEITRLAYTLGLDVNRIRADSSREGARIVKADERAAHRLGLAGTPTFLLCCPGGRVLQAFALQQLDRYVR